MLQLESYEESSQRIDRLVNSGVSWLFNINLEERVRNEIHYLFERAGYKWGSEIREIGGEKWFSYFSKFTPELSKEEYIVGREQIKKAFEDSIKNITKSGAHSQYMRGELIAKINSVQD